MKSSRSILFVLIMFLTFVSVTVIVFKNASSLLSHQFFTVLGTGAQDMAVMVAGQIELTDKDVEILKQMEYKDIAAHPVNQQLQKLDQLKTFQEKTNCIYVATFLQPDEVKYYVTEENKNYYRAAVGQPLNVMWLLDAYMGEKNTEQGKENWQEYYKRDIERYAFYSKKDKKALEEKQTTYFFSYDDQEGKIITAYAPIWSKEGRYIGLLGIDLSIESLENFKNKVFICLSSLLIITNLTLAAVLAACYYKYMKLVNERMYCDPLTKIYNRRYYKELFFKELEKRKLSEEMLVVVMLDIDYFKWINDTYGHAVGDECLIGIASGVEKSIREKKGIAVRFGGEEFLITFFIKNFQEVEAVMKQMMTEIIQPDFTTDACGITVSLGAHVVACEEIKKENIESFIKKADLNLYQAKNNGRKQYCVTQSDKLSCK